MSDEQLSLGQRQELFVALLGKLIDFVYQKGWRFRLSDFGNQQGLKHMKNSLHGQRLAADFNLFVEKNWITHDSPEWQEIGAFWKTLDPLCCWGGDFLDGEGKPVGDYNHFSITYAGKK